MSERLTEQRLAEIRDRLEAITSVPGRPWTWNGVCHVWLAETPDADDVFIAATEPDASLAGYAPTYHADRIANARLIAHAPADLRDLLDALAGRDNDRLREALREALKLTDYAGTAGAIRDVCRKALGEDHAAQTT